MYDMYESEPEGEEVYSFPVTKGFLKRGFVRGGGGRSPDTGYYRFIVTGFAPFGEADKNDAVSIGVKADFADVSGQWGRGTVWRDFYDSDGNPVPGVAKLQETDEKAFDKLMQAYATDINTFLASCGTDMDQVIGDEADDEEEIDPTATVGSIFYGVWLAPLKTLVSKEEQGQYDWKKGDSYGTIDAFITEAQYETFMAAGAVPKDDRSAVLAKRRKAGTGGMQERNSGDGSGTARTSGGTPRRRATAVTKPVDTEKEPKKASEPEKAAPAGLPRRARTGGGLPGAPRK